MDGSLGSMDGSLGRGVTQLAADMPSPLPMPGWGHEMLWVRVGVRVCLFTSATQPRM